MTIHHLLSGNELSPANIHALLTLAGKIKKQPKDYHTSLDGKQIALIFDKPSLRTRFSFTAGINQLGAQAIEGQNQTSKKEDPKDKIRVLQGYCDAIMIRTFADEDLQEMQQYANIPIINGLTDRFHPCQTLADLLTLQECFDSLDNLTICYIGDGNNILHSLLIIASKLGIHINYCCPRGREPEKAVLELLADNGHASLATPFNDPVLAATGAHAIYTDVWTSMGFAEADDQQFSGFQVNETLMQHAAPNAVFMHCMPMQRGKEVSETLPDAKCSVIFQQSENRLHVQKALLVHLLQEPQS